MLYPLLPKCPEAVTRAGWKFFCEMFFIGKCWFVKSQTFRGQGSILTNFSTWKHFGKKALEIVKIFCFEILEMIKILFATSKLLFLSKFKLYKKNSFYIKKGHSQNKRFKFIYMKMLDWSEPHSLEFLVHKIFKVLTFCSISEQENLLKSHNFWWDGKTICCPALAVILIWLYNRPTVAS